MNEQEFIEKTKADVQQLIKSSVQEISTDFDKHAQDFIEYAEIIAKLQWKVISEGDTPQNKFALANANVAWKLRAARIANKFEGQTNKIVLAILQTLATVATSFAGAYISKLPKSS